MIAKKAPNPIDKHVGSRVRMRRMMLGMSQEKLGDALGLTFQQVQKYEKGTNRIGASRLQQISHILQVSGRVLLRRCAGRATVEPSRRHGRGALARLCLRLSRHVGRLGAHQSVHAHRRFQIAAAHRRPCRANRHLRQTLKCQPSRGVGLAHFRPHLDRAEGRCNNLSRISAGGLHRAMRRCGDRVSFTRGVFRSATCKLSVHERVRVGRTPGQGLRPDLGCHTRCLSRERHQARHCRRQQSQYAARLRDAVHDE